MPLVTARPVSMNNGDLVTEFVDTVGTNGTTWTYPASQNHVQVINEGTASVTVVVSGNTKLIPKGGSWNAGVTFTSITINSESGVQKITVRSVRKKTNIVKTIGFPKIMSDPPTVTLGVNSEASTITNAVTVKSVDHQANNVINEVFVYEGDVAKAGEAYPDRDFVRNRAVTTTSSFGNLIVRFGYFGSKFEIYEKGQGGRVRILVDGEYIGKDAEVVQNSTGVYYRLIDFKSYGFREITIELSGAYFGGLKIEPNATVTRPKSSKTRAIFFGDSITEAGSSGANISYGWPTIAARMLGWECWNSGVGGTGYINPGAAGRVKFIDRVMHDVVMYSPDVVVSGGGFNDETNSKEAVYTAAKRYFTTLKQHLPTTEIIVVSPHSPTGIIPQIRKDIADKLRGVALELKFPYIDMVNGATYNKNGEIITPMSGGWITGTGHAGNIQTTGNASLFISADGVHPTREGHFYIGQRIATEIYNLYK